MSKNLFITRVQRFISNLRRLDYDTSMIDPDSAPYWSNNHQLWIVSWLDGKATLHSDNGIEMERTLV